VTGGGRLLSLHNIVLLHQQEDVAMSWESDPSYMRGMVHGEAPTDYKAALSRTRRIDNAWYRCQSLAFVVPHCLDFDEKLSILAEAFDAALSLGEPNRIVTVAAWPVGALVADGMHELLAEKVEILPQYPGPDPARVRSKQD